VSAALLSLLLLQSPDGGTLEKVAEQISAQAPGKGAEAPLAVAVTAPGHPALRDAFSTLLVARLTDAGLAPALIPVGSDAEGLARAHGARTLLRVRLMVSHQKLQASGQVSSLVGNFFSGRAPSRPGLEAVVFSGVALDEATRALVAEATSLWLAPEPLAQWPVRTAAVAAGRLEGEEGVQVAVLTEDAVEVRALDGKLLARRALAHLPLAEYPSREPFGTLCVCDGLLYAFSASRAVGEVLALEAGSLVLRAPLARPVVGCGQPLLEATFLPGVARLQPASSFPRPLLSGAPAWGLFTRQLSSPEAMVVALREDGTATVLLGTGQAVTLAGVGAGAALLAGEDQGALAILVASSSGVTPAEDTLRFLFVPDGTTHGTLDVSGRILQVATAFQGFELPDALVLGVWKPGGGSELRLVRWLR
jgi:hypothetical protein